MSVIQQGTLRQARGRGCLNYRLYPTSLVTALTAIAEGIERCPEIRLFKEGRRWRVALLDWPRPGREHRWEFMKGAEALAMVRELRRGFGQFGAGVAA